MKEAEDAGIHGFLIKPVSNSILFDTIISVMGHEEGRAQRKEKKKGFDRDSLKPIRGARVLLVEDNEINQQVASELLEGAGLRVFIASNGREGKEAALRDEYDIVLMDIQMPEMDGFEATRQIRRSGKEGIEKLPILGMTANAMAGDRERSLEAGMNDHVTKPIDPDQLFSSLLRWISPGEREELPGHGVELSNKPERALPELPGVNTGDAIRRVGGNVRLYRELLGKFVRDSAGAHGDIVEALERGDRELARRLAHTVKGTAGNIGASGLYDTAGTLESAIANEDGEAVREALEVFRESLERVIEALRPVIAAQEAGKEAPAGAPGDRAKLRELLRELQDHAQKQKPKHCKDVVKEIAGSSWTGEFTDDLAALGRLIGSYKFKESQVILERLLEKL